MATTNSAAASLALTRITYAWGLAIAPHALKLVMLGVSGYKWDNRIGRANMAKDSKDYRISPQALARAKRADMAHANGNESVPLFGIAVLAATTAGVDAGAIDLWTKAYLALRVIYNVIFILGESQAIALLRTFIWGGSVYTSINLIRMAAKTYAAKAL